MSNKNPKSATLCFPTRSLAALARAHTVLSRTSAWSAAARSLVKSKVVARMASDGRRFLTFRTSLGEGKVSLDEHWTARIDVAKMRELLSEEEVERWTTKHRTTRLLVEFYGELPDTSDLEGKLELWPPSEQD